ncbi:MAG: rhodanese-like domain-containing protein [Bacteroidia bacterium]
MDIFLRNKLIIIGIAAGAAGGFLYYYFIGCTGDSCTITSNPVNSTLYGAMMGGLFFSIFKKEKPNSELMKLEKIIKENEGTIIDVRTSAEFNGANTPGSINIPLNEISARLDELKSMKKPLILCCASGGRSGQAASFLSRQGLECYNAGSWIDVKYYKSKQD